ncbi:MAG: hypothetical protein HOP10_16365 [Chitinophagaceae bacterium]|nr:hypothetical protein [Chitinophagaceae bacterium]
MKLALTAVLLFCITASHCQVTADNTNDNTSFDQATFSHSFKSKKLTTFTAGEIKIGEPQRWKLNGNKLWTGGLILLSGAAKGFNETLEFNWHGFAAVFPKASPQWFWPQKSFTNKYKDNDPEKGAKFPLSTSALVFLTDQYHLNNFIQRSAITAALVIKIGEKKKPFKHYVFDALYHTAAYQAGFCGVYYYFKSRVPK